MFFSLARDNLPGLVRNLASNVINIFDRKISWKGFFLFISKKVMNYRVKIIKSLEYLGVLNDGATETVKHEIKNKKVSLS